MPYMDVLALSLWVYFLYSVFCPFTSMRWICKTPACSLSLTFPYHMLEGWRHCAGARSFGMRRREWNRMIAWILDVDVCVVAGALYSRRYMRFLHIRLCGKINFAQLSLLITLSRFTFIFTCKEIITLNWTCFFHYMNFTFEQKAFEIENANGCFMRKSRNEHDKLQMSPCSYFFSVHNFSM